MKMLLFMASAFLTLSAASHAASPGGGFHGGSFHGGFVAHGAHPAFRMGHGIRRNFAFHRDFAFDKTAASFIATIVSFFNSLLGLFTGTPTTIRSPIPIWTTDRIMTISIGTIRQRLCNRNPSDRAADNKPTVIVINTGNSRPIDSSSNTGSINRGYSSTDAAGQQRIVMQDPNEKIAPRADPRTFVTPAVPQPTQTAAKVLK